MKCKFCDDDMEGVDCWDNPNEGFAHNLYQCDNCGTIAQQRVWGNKGVTWIKVDGAVYEEK